MVKKRLGGGGAPKKKLEEMNKGPRGRKRAFLSLKKNKKKHSLTHAGVSKIGGKGG